MSVKTVEVKAEDRSKAINHVGDLLQALDYLRAKQEAAKSKLNA